MGMILDEQRKTGAEVCLQGNNALRAIHLQPQREAGSEGTEEVTALLNRFSAKNRLNIGEKSGTMSPIAKTETDSFTTAVQKGAHC